VANPASRRFRLRCVAMRTAPAGHDRIVAATPPPGQRHRTRRARPLRPPAREAARPGRARARTPTSW
jgi:hypothetical protein